MFTLFFVANSSITIGSDIKCQCATQLRGHVLVVQSLSALQLCLSGAPTHRDSRKAWIAENVHFLLFLLLLFQGVEMHVSASLGEFSIQWTLCLQYVPATVLLQTPFSSISKSESLKPDLLAICPSREQLSLHSEAC